MKATVLVWLDGRLDKVTNTIMSVLTDFLAAQKNFNAQQAASLAVLGTALEGVKIDINAQNAKIAELLARDIISDEDKLLINELGEAGAALVGSLESATTALKVLDEANPPAAPAPDTVG